MPFREIIKLTTLYTTYYIIFFYYCFQHFKWLQSHIKGTHEDAKPYQCDKCDQKFATSGYLASHKYYRHKLKKDSVCDTCGFTTKGKQSLKRHIESKHEKKKNYTCNICEDTHFYSKTTYKIHTQGEFLIYISRHFFFILLPKGSCPLVWATI